MEEKQAWVAPRHLESISASQRISCLSPGRFRGTGWRSRAFENGALVDVGVMAALGQRRLNPQTTGIDGSESCLCLTNPVRQR